MVYFRRVVDKGDWDGLINLVVCYDNGWVEGYLFDKVWIYFVLCVGWFYYCEVFFKWIKFLKCLLWLNFEIWIGKVFGNLGNCWIFEMWFMEWKFELLNGNLEKKG